MFRILFWIEFWIESFLGLIQWKNELSKRINFCLVSVIFANRAYLQYAQGYNFPIRTTQKILFPSYGSFFGLTPKRPARFSFLENSWEFLFIFTCSRSPAVSISLSLLTSFKKEWRDFIFHFSILKKMKAIHISLFFLEKKSEIMFGI